MCLCPLRGNWEGPLGSGGSDADEEEDQGDEIWEGPLGGGGSDADEEEDRGGKPPHWKEPYLEKKARLALLPGATLGVKRASRVAAWEKADPDNFAAWSKYNSAKSKKARSLESSKDRKHRLDDNAARMADSRLRESAAESEQRHDDDAARKADSRLHESDANRGKRLRADKAKKTASRSTSRAASAASAAAAVLANRENDLLRVKRDPSLADPHFFDDMHVNEAEKQLLLLCSNTGISIFIFFLVFLCIS